MDLYFAIFQGIIIASTPLVLAAIGELIVEKSGVLNLGVEGMMIIGAVASFIVTYETGSHLMGILAAIIASGLIAIIFGVLTQYLLSNQVATGLALTLFGLGLSSLIGQNYSGISLKASSNSIWFKLSIMVKIKSEKINIITVKKYLLISLKLKFISVNNNLFIKT